MNTLHWLNIVDRIGPEFAERASERDAHDGFITTHYPVLKERGLIAAMVPEELGGGGASHSTVAAILKRLAYYDGSTALALAMHQHLVAAQAFNHRQGRPAPLLPRVATEQLVLVSTGARDWLASTGSMRRVDGGFRVSARKAFASGSPAGDIVVTSAPYEDPEAGWQVLHFAVPMHPEGVRLDRDWCAHGMRGTGSATVIFEDVFVPDAAISLGRPRGEYHDIWNVVITVAMPLIAAVYVGIAERAAEIGLEFARREATDPAVQWAAGETRSALLTAQVLHDRMVALANDLDVTPSLALSDEMLVLKTGTIEHAQRAVERAMEAAGGAGYYRRNGLERLLRDVRAGHYHPLPAKQQLLFSGRVALGLDPVAAWAPPAGASVEESPRELASV